MPDRLSTSELPSETDLRGDRSTGATPSERVKFSSREAFEDLLRLHRKRAPAEEVHFLDRLCFPLDETADAVGLRFVLWQPVALFLQHGFQVEIEGEMCDGQVVLAYVRHDGAAFLNKIIQQVDRGRRLYPQIAVSSGPQILIQVLPAIANDLQLFFGEHSYQEVFRMLRPFKDAIRRGDYLGLPALRAQLAEYAAASIKESDLRACIEILRAGGEDGCSWPPHSAALASERALARDWLTPEEDAAWSYLQEVT
jgi:hypothetical protein